jgi:hypothetical protein
MGIGIVLNQLASMQTALSGISSTMSALGSVASSIGAALGKAFVFAKDKAVEIFNQIKDAFEGVVNFMKTIWEATIVPFWNLIKEGMMFWVNIFKGEWGKALDNAKTIWNATMGKLWEGLKTGAIMAFEGLKSLWGTITGTMSKIFDATIGRAFEGLKNAATSVFDTIKGAWDTVTGVMQSIYDNTLGKIFDAIGGALSGIFDFGKKVVGGIGDALGFGGGGGGGSTTVGTAVSGGVTYNFDMTFNLSGITDSTDKREMAREIGDLIQQEITRSTGGGRMRGRYS